MFIYLVFFTVFTFRYIKLRRKEIWKLVQVIFVHYRIILSCPCA